MIWMGRSLPFRGLKGMSEAVSLRVTGGPVCGHRAQACSVCTPVTFRIFTKRTLTTE